MNFPNSYDFSRRTRKVYPYNIVINEVGANGPINGIQVSEKLNMRRTDAQRWLNKARNESHIILYPEEHIEKISSIFNPERRELNNNKYYIKRKTN